MDEVRKGLSEILMGMSESAASARSGGESLVAIRPEVLSDAEHALGNLFQRIYHVTRVARDGLGAHADRLIDTVRDLEQLLDLLFDYVSPVELELRPVDCARVAESLATHVRGERPAQVQPGAWSGERVMADPWLLGRSFQLMACALLDGRGAAPEVTIGVDRDAVAQRVAFTAALAGVVAGSRSAASELAWEVAGRLIDLHGGDLRRRARNGGVTLTVGLPLFDGAKDAE